MQTVNDISEKPSLDDALEHYGIKGMKWGVRRSDAQLKRARGERKQARKEKNAKIHDARARVSSKDRQIRRQIDAVNLAEEGKKQAEEFKKLEKMSVEHLKSPDRDMAITMTTGEKAATAAIGALLPGVGTAVALGMVGGNVAQKADLKRARKKAGV